MVFVKKYELFKLLLFCRYHHYNVWLEVCVRTSGCLNNKVAESSLALKNAYHSTEWSKLYGDLIQQLPE